MVIEIQAKNGAVFIKANGQVFTELSQLPPIPLTVVGLRYVRHEPPSSRR